jgi:hypothetical protein
VASKGKTTGGTVVENSVKAARILDANGNVAATFPAATSAARYLSFENSSTGDSPYIKALGTGDNIGMTVVPKGSGAVAIYQPSGSALLQILSPVANCDFRVYPKGTGKMYVGDVEVPTISSVSTLSAKRINPRSVTAASASALTPEVEIGDFYAFTALAAALTIEVPTGTPVAGNRLMFRIKDNGTPRALTWNAIYRAIGVTLPTTTVANKVVYVSAIYNATDTKWDVLDVKQEV